MKHKVVFDWDGVFNNQTEWLCEHMGIPVPDRYGTMLSTNLTPNQKEVLEAAYRNMDLYRQIPLAEGLTELLRNFKDCLYICAGSTGVEMQIYKKNLVLTLDPDFPTKQIVISRGMEKPVLSGVTIAVDDGPRYLDAYGQDVTKILVHHSYNEFAGDSYLRVADFNAAVAKVKEMVGRG